MHHLIMKAKFVIVFSFLQCITVNDFAQIKKVYAYKQASIPGINIGDDDFDIKDDKPAKKTERKTNFNYWFYVAVPKNEKVKVTGLWISGRQYEIKQDSITDLPVKKIINTGLEKNDTIIMAPVTANKILLVCPGSEKTNESKYVANLSKTNEMVIRYIWKNKTYFTTIKKIKELNPDVRV